MAEIKDLKLYSIPDTSEDTIAALTPAELSTTIGSQIKNFSEPAVMQQGYFESGNFVSGSAGWRLSPNGDFEGNNGTFRGSITGASGTFSGTITATTGAIGGFDIGADFIRDAANTMGLASTVTGGDDVRFWAGASFANRATAPFNITEAGAAVFTNITVGGTTTTYLLNNNGIFSFGDGSDGALTTSGNVTLTSDKYYTNLTVSTGDTVFPAGYRIFCTGTLTLSGTGKITRNGVNGSAGSAGTDSSGGVAGIGGAGGAGGTALADGYLKGALAGATGGTGENGRTNGVAANGGSGSGTATSNSIAASNGANGGVGGDGGAGTAAAGSTGGTSAGGTSNASNVKLIANWHLATLLDVGSTGATVKFNNAGSSAGGGGGASGGGSSAGGVASAGGGGGGGAGSAGGIIAIYARNIVIGASAVITANGGTGANGANAGNVGGGGDVGGSGGGGSGAGGNGGQIILVYNAITNSGSITVSGGTAGVTAGNAGTNTGAGVAGTNGAVGSTGNVGLIRTFLISL